MRGKSESVREEKKKSVRGKIKSEGKSVYLKGNSRKKTMYYEKK